MQHNKASSHLIFVETKLIFRWAEHGARYDIPTQCTIRGVDCNFSTAKDKALHDLWYLWPFRGPVRFLECYVERIACLLAVGESPHFGKPDKSMLQKFETFLVKNMDRNMVHLLMESGYRPQELASAVEEGEISVEEVEKFQANFNRVLSLQRLAANVIRTSLRPNAVAGLQHLPLPVMFDKTFITLGLTQEKSKPGFLSMQHNT